jgi:hypothetical protein
MEARALVLAALVRARAAAKAAAAVVRPLPLVLAALLQPLGGDYMEAVSSAPWECNHAIGGMGTVLSLFVGEVVVVEL